MSVYETVADLYVSLPSNTAEIVVVPSALIVTCPFSVTSATDASELVNETFKLLGCSGVGRIDFLMDKETGKVYVNEINTIPGALSYYLWEATGKSFEKEIDELVQIALRRDRDKNKLTFSYDQNIFALSGGAKGGTKGSKISKK